MVKVRVLFIKFGALYHSLKYTVDIYNQYNRQCGANLFGMLDVINVVY